MAEVPEVETLVGDLREAIVGRTIHSTDVLYTAAVRFPSDDEFTNLLAGRVFMDAHRRAKYILLSLSGDALLAVHLALWGTLVLVPAGQPHLAETLIVWHLDQEEDLTLDELTRLHAAIVQQLTEGVALRGTQRDLFGRKGGAVHRRYIFERTREPCPRCGTPVAYLKIGGRNTHFCPQCQR